MLSSSCPSRSKLAQVSGKTAAATRTKELGMWTQVRTLQALQMLWFQVLSHLHSSVLIQARKHTSSAGERLETGGMPPGG